MAAGAACAWARPAANCSPPPDPFPDWRAHAAASMTFLENTIDRRTDRLVPYFRIDFAERPGILRHEHWDWSENTGRWLYGRMYARRVLEDYSGLDFEEALKATIYQGIAPDGLHYYPSQLPCSRQD